MVVVVDRMTAPYPDWNWLLETVVGSWSLFLNYPLGSFLPFQGLTTKGYGFFFFLRFVF